MVSFSVDTQFFTPPSHVRGDASGTTLDRVTWVSTLATQRSLRVPKRLSPYSIPYRKCSRCLGMLTDQEVARCEARLGSVALFMPTQPDGEYKLDLRDFGDRQIVTLLLGKCLDRTRADNACVPEPLKLRKASFPKILTNYVVSVDFE